MIFKNKKVLQVGLGILGGGVGTANYLIKKGAILTITDLKTKKDLKNSIKKIKVPRLRSGQAKKVAYRLGKHDEKDFRQADIIVFNQSVPFGSRWVKFAQKLKKPIESDLTIFSGFLKGNKGEYIGITGTRGKTTTSHWLSHFLPEATLGGNMPAKGLAYLATLKKKLYVLELSSFQLEYANEKTLPPKIAIITNLYIDHLNYHGTLKKYFRAKYKIFANQTKNDYLILNRDNKNTKSILKAKPKSKIYFFALSPLSLKVDVIFAEEDRVVFQKNGQRKFICKLKKDFTGHLRSNLLPAMLAAYLYGENWETICRKIKGLPQVPFRQEIIIKRPNLTVINDSAATSPEATMAAIERFRSQDTPRPLGRGVSKLILICGGTDKQLDFRGLVKQIIKNIEPD